MNLIHTVKQNFIPAFEARSLFLVAALALGAGSAAQAQSSAAQPLNEPAGAPAQMAPSQATPTSPAAAAKATPKELEAAFKQSDANGDKKLSLQEAAAFPGLPERFQQIDTDKDKFVSLKEFMKAATGS